MWKREEAPERIEPERAPVMEPRPASQPLRRDSAAIGPSITIHGDVTGDEDLVIQGSIQGSVQLDQHAVTVGDQGEVRANVSARAIIVEGTVEGNLHAHEQIVLRSTARVLGDIIAPRVVLENGAYFRGGIDMGEPSDSSQRPGEAKRAGARRDPAAASNAAKPAGAAPPAAPAQIALDA